MEHFCINYDNFSSLYSSSLAGQREPTDQVHAL